MKRFLRYALVAVTAVFVTVACEPENPDNPVPEIPSAPEEARLASASFETISGYPVCWEKDSRFIVGYSSGASSKTIELSLKEGEGSTAGKFSYDFKGELPAPSYAIFPTGLVKEAGSGISDCTLLWPTEQKYGEPSITSLPMWAKGDASGNLNGPYKFQSIGGILHFSVTGTGSISRVQIVSDKPLSGVFHLDILGNPIFEDGSKSVYNNIDLSCGHSMNLSEEVTDFYFSVPAGYYAGLTVNFESDAGCSDSYEVKGLVEITAGKVTDISLNGIKGYGAGKLIRVDAEHDITYENIKAALFEMVPQAQSFGGILDLVVRGYIASRTRLSRIIYLTPDRDGQLTEASGLVAYQPDAGSYDRIVSLQHGTCDIAGAPSYQDFYPEIASAAISGKSHIVVMADYLGYGASQSADLQHPYLSKSLTGSCCADMLAAAEEFIADTDLSLRSDRIDLVGYSQGGAATMAALLELEKRGGYDERIGEVWAGAGPYDIMGFLEYFKDKETYDKTGFIPYTFRGICYGEHLDLDYDHLYHPSLVERVNLETLFSTKQVSEWHRELGYTIKNIIHPDFYKDNYGDNADIAALAAALEKNSIVNFDAPKNIDRIKLYHSVTDDTVPYSCSEALQKAWGIPEITELQARNDHVLGGIEFLLDYCGLERLAAILIPLIN